MKTTKLAFIGVTTVTVGALAWWGLAMKQVADNLVIEVSLPQMIGIKNGKFEIAVDVTIRNDASYGFSMTRPSVTCHFKDFFDNDAYAYTEPSSENIAIAAKSIQVIKGIKLGLPLTIFPNQIASILVGAIPALESSFGGLAKPLAFDMTIRTGIGFFFIDDVFPVVYHTNFSFDTKEMTRFLRDSIIPKKATGTKGIGTVATIPMQNHNHFERYASQL